MIIGFSKPTLTISEDPIIDDVIKYIPEISIVFPGSYDADKITNSLTFLPVDVISLRQSEIEYEIGVRQNGGNATIIRHFPDSLVGDAGFGASTKNGSLLEEYAVLPSLGNYTEPPITAVIVNDIIPEPFECFTLSIFNSSSNIFHCSDDSESVSEYFCEHTICIEDNDG